MANGTRQATDRTRRRLLAGLATAAGAGLLPFTSAGCGRRAEDPPAPFTAVPRAAPVVVPLEHLAGGRTVVFYGEVPVEVRTVEGRGAEALALLCTHQGCRVVWKPDHRTYDCACHEGRFDQAGQPIAGLARLPLMRVPVTVSATAVTVGGA
jgi:Rieske Fe-S protein